MIKKNTEKIVEFDKLDINEIDPETKQYVTEWIALHTEKIDILDLVNGYQDEKIIQHLRANGIDGFKVRNILLDSFGFTPFHGYSVSYTQEEMKRDKKIFNAIRKISALCNNSLLTNNEIKLLRKTELRLKKTSFRFSRDTIDAITTKTKDNGDLENICCLGSSGYKPLDGFKIKIKNGKALLDCRADMPSPKSTKQYFGVQMVALFDYIQKFNHGQYIDKEIYGLIAALFKKMNSIEFDTDQIKKYIENNKIIYKKINSTRKTTKSKNARTSIKS